jgi:hypothetical protein
MQVKYASRQELYPSFIDAEDGTKADARATTDGGGTTVLGFNAVARAVTGFCKSAEGRTDALRADVTGAGVALRADKAFWSIKFRICRESAPSERTERTPVDNSLDDAGAAVLRAFCAEKTGAVKPTTHKTPQKHKILRKFPLIFIAIDSTLFTFICARLKFANRFLAWYNERNNRKTKNKKQKTNIK